MKLAKRIENLAPYLFAEIDKKIAEKKASALDVISLGIGDPVEPTPQHIIEKLCQEAQFPPNHQYPSYYGLKELREAIRDWCYHRFQLNLDPDREILPLIGSKEGIAHIFLALIDPGDLALIPDPGYPVYQSGNLFAGGVSHFMPLLKENDFLPNLNAISSRIAERAKLIFINYPNNPTSATATLDFFKEVVKFAKKFDLVVCHDNAYSEITFDGYKAPSFLQVPGAMDVGIEFHSLSKTYNMTGWRIGFAVGNAKVIEALGRVKTNIDSGIFNPIQYAGIAALKGPQESIKAMCCIYQKRRDKVIETLKKIGIEVKKPKATFYIWVPVPRGHSSTSFTEFLLEKAGVVVSPGIAYGSAGEGYVRISLTVNDEKLNLALKRIERAFKGVREKSG